MKTYAVKYFLLALFIVSLSKEAYCEGTSQDPLMAQGKKIYEDMQCGSCHVFRKEGVSNIGPKLDEIASTMDGTMIREAIIEPNRSIASGFKADIMPKDYRDKMSNADLDALIYYLTNEKLDEN
ncbi:MAG: cytochrome c [Deltaproteobacteria bacterium]|nr:cytochrome c [Deltaproteobacteria bacterium]